MIFYNQKKKYTALQTLLSLLTVGVCLSTRSAQASSTAGEAAEPPAMCSGMGGPANVTASYSPMACSTLFGNTYIPIALSGGMTPEQCDCILKLVNISEQGDIYYWNYYGTIADIGDGNGYTWGIAGFTTADGDGLWFVEDLLKFDPTSPLASYLPALKKLAAKGSSSHTGLSGFPATIESLAQDPNFRRASWDTMLYYYWNPAMAVVEEYGLQYPISKGQVYDIVMNSGDTTIFPKVTATPPSKGGNELTWLENLQALWKKELSPGGIYSFEGPGRANMWIKILQSGNLELKMPFTADQDGTYLVE
jgi:chitosanase